MLIYNVTTKLVHSIHAEWLQWMKEHHIPAVLATGCFSEAKILRLLEVDEEEGPTYAVQYTAGGQDVYDQYVRDFAPALRQETLDKWGNQIMAFRSLMEIVN